MVGIDHVGMGIDYYLGQHPFSGLPVTLAILVLTNKFTISEVDSTKTITLFGEISILTSR